MPRRFSEYMLLREMDDKRLQTDIVLGKGNDFKPFVVSDEEDPTNKNLAPIIRAFNNANKVKVYDSMGKGGKSKPHTLSPKSLYMVGGAVRDHLLGKTPHDIDLATDATPDEIRMILMYNDFVERTPDHQERSDKSFYVKGKDKSGTDFVFGVLVNGQEFDLATFRKDSHGSDGRIPDQMSFGGQADDAARRDLTINNMYILLNNPEGNNDRLTDFHGGIRDIMSGRVKFVGNPESRLEEDLLRALRYARFAARFGTGEVDPEVLQAIHKVAPRILNSVSPERVQQEFVRGIEDDDTDPVKLIDIYRKLGLLNVVFPGMNIKLDSLNDYPRDRDRAVVVASLLRGNPPEAIQQCLQQGRWSAGDIARVMFLHQILGLHPHIDSDELARYLKAYNASGIMGKSVARWWNHAGKGDPGVVHAFLDFAKGPRVKTMVINGETGENQLDPDFAPFFDPVTMAPVPGVGPHVGALKKAKEHRNFQDLLRSYLSHV